MAHRAIIGIGTYDDAFQRSSAVARAFDAGGNVIPADYHLSFATAAQLFAELTPKRMETLEVLKRSGAQSINQLAKRLGRNYSNVHADIAKLLEHGLVDKDGQGRVFVP
jgi:predicted transcriptional regulator